MNMRTVSDDETDEALLERAFADDGEAFGLLYDRHKRRVMASSYRCVRQFAEAEDVTAVVFLEAWRRRGSIRLVNGTILPWLLIVTINIARNQNRSLRRYSAFLSELPAPEPAPDHAEAVAMRLDQIGGDGPTWSAFAALTAKDQTILTLCVIEDLPLAGAATALGLPIGTVKSRLSRAKARLRARIEATNGAEPSTLMEVRNQT